MKKYILTAATLFLIQSGTAFAVFPTPSNGSLSNPFPQPRDTVLKDSFSGGPKDVISFINIIANWVFAILITISVIYILLAAYKYLSSKGGEGVGDAHKMLMYAAVGIAVAVLAKGIVFAVRRLADSSTPLTHINTPLTHSHDA